LLEDLRRLRQRVKLAVMDAAGHKKIARALRRRAREHGRLDFEKAHFVHHFADFENDSVAQREIAMRLRASQVEVAETQTRFFRGIDFVFDRKRRRLRVVENVQFRRDQFDLAAGQFQISLLALDDFAFHGHDKFTARLLGFGVRCRLRLFVEDHLNDAGAVANIEEEQIAEVAPARHPAHYNGVAPFVLGAQFTAVMCAFQIAQKIQHGLCHLKSCAVPILSKQARCHAERIEASQLIISPWFVRR
jgi:hypothetical protein